ncbi:MAG TPA: AraC family transcriptional regulator [Calditrichia bacterium]|nr:helix-turn-helix domain-containing protein [Calditrichota bacterium]HQU73381.1 AraC family transcriptional regulator [Calditrichia bacterium]HQV30674.1 AraC family transcriptional regulator [Calditrichia bacterium]
MVNLYATGTAAALLRPRRVMRQILIWCREGELSIIVDDKKLTLRPREVLTITSGQYHYFEDLEGGEGLVLEFTTDFFCKDDHDIELVFHNGLFCHFDLNEVIPLPGSPVVEEQLQLIREELSERPFQYLTSVHARIKLILVEINRAKIGRGDEIYQPDALFLKFLDQVRSQFNHALSLRDYADQLNTSEARLNEASRLHAGKSAQNVVYGLIASEAKRLLIYEKLSVKEIAFRLGFNDPFYFSNFFKKHAGLSPSAYKEKLVG